MSAISNMDAHDLSEAYAKRDLSPVDVVADILERIDRVQPILNAFTRVDHEGALEAARRAEARWISNSQRSRWDGVPATIKDLVATKDWTPSVGSHVLTFPLVGVDAPAPARLREAGCVLLGMTASPEMGWKGVTDSPRFGITRNAWNPDRTPGGSSGGAAVAAALQLGCFHIGTDGGGSVRMPSAFSGIFGHKPTFGRVPAFPASNFGTLAHVGPMTRTVRDGIEMLNIISKPDRRDWYALPAQPAVNAARVDRLEGLKIAYSPDLGYMQVDPEVAGLVNKGVEALADLGAHVDEITMPFGNVQDVFDTLWFGAARHKLAKLGVEEQRRLDPGLLAACNSMQGLSAQAYMDAGLARAEIGAQAEALLSEWDVLVTPTVPMPAFKAGFETPTDAGRWTDWAAFTYVFNLSQQPACTIPCGFTADGLPVGLQIIAAKYRDDLALRIASAYQLAHPVPWPSTDHVLSFTTLGEEQA